MTILKKITSLLSLLLLFVFLPSESMATHIVGGDMTYRCLGNDKYEVTLTVRRDCENGADEAQLDDPATIGIFDRFGALQIILGDDLGRSYTPITEYRIISNSLVDDCRIPDTGDLCVEEAIYRDTICLPYNKIGYYLAYQRCCRNEILNNIMDPLGTGASYHVFISAQAALECNSQPAFNDWQNIYVCANEPFEFDHSGVDPDGDEIRYKLCAPSSGATIDNPKPFLPSRPPYDIVTWNNGYTIDNLFGSGTPLTIDPTSGLLTATPQVTGTYLIGVCMEEYRDGVLFSEVRRDFEVNVVPCDNPITVDYNVNGSDCTGGTTINFSNQTVGANEFLWYFDYPNTDPAFTSTVQNPTFTYPSTGTYTVRLEAKRSSDGCTKAFESEIVVGGVAPKAEFIALPVMCAGDQVTVQFDDSTIGSSSYTQEWSINGSTFTSSPFSLTFDRNETIIVNYSITTDAGCVSNQNQAINLNDLINSAYFDVDLISCNGSTTTVQLTNPTGAPTSWTVTDGNGAQTMFSGSSVTTNISTETFTITMESDNGCDAGPISEIYNLGDFFDNAIDVQLVSCSPSGNIYSFTNLTNANVTWTVVDGARTFTVQGDFATPVIQSENFSVTASFDNNCYADITNNYNEGTFLQADFEVELVSCTGNGNFYNFINNSGTVANWTIVGSSTSNQTGHIVSGFIDSDNFSVTIELDNGCSTPYTETFNAGQFVNPPKAEFDLFPISCNGDEVTVRFEDSTIGGDRRYSQSWNINGTSFSSSPFTMTFDRSDNIRVFYEIATNDGCATSLQNQTINLEELINSAYFNVELVSCDASGNLISLSNPSGTPTTWTIIDGTNPAITLSGANITTTLSASTFTITMESNNGCGAAPITEVYSISDFIDSAIDIQLMSCTSAGNIFSFTNLTNSNVVWTVVDGNRTYNLQGDFVTPSIQATNFTVTASFDNSCYGDITNSYNADSFLQADFEVELVACTANGNFYNFINTSGTVADWTIVGSTTTTQTGHTVSEFIAAENFTVTIDLDNGCSTPYTQTFNAGQFQNAPKAEFDAYPISCNGDEVTVRFEDSTIGGNRPYAQSWNVNGLTFISSPFTMTFDRSENIIVSYQIDTRDGCSTSVQNQAINLEDLINSAYFDVDLISCDASGTMIALTNPAGVPTSWTIIDANNQSTMLTGANVSTTVATQTFTILMESDNGCGAGVISEDYNLSEFFDSAVNVQLVNCTGAGSLFSFTNLTNANASWSVQDGNVIKTATGDFVSLFIENSSFSVTTTFDNSCYDPITNTYNVDSFTQPSFDVELVSCTTQGLIFNFVNSSGTVANWSINDGGNITEQVGHTISGTVVSDNFTVTMDLNNGCSGPYSETFDVNDLQPTLAIGDNLGGDCLDPNGQIVSLNPSITGGNILSQPATYNWQYDIDGGASTTSTDQFVSVTLLPGQIINATLTVEYHNGCSYTVSDIIEAGNSSGNATLAINNNLNSPCIDPNGQAITFNGVVTGGNVSSYGWTYFVQGQAQQTSSDASITVTLVPGQSVTMTLVATLEDGCTIIANETFVPSSAIVPRVNEDINCDNPDETIITLSDFTNVGGTGAVSYQWNVNGQQSDQPFVVFSVTDTPVTANLLITYNNGCTATYSKTFDPASFTPTLDYTVECIDGLFEFVFTGFVPECYDLSMITWMINGMTYTGPVVRVELPFNESIDVGLSVTYTNGLVVDATDPSLTTINTGDYLNMVPVEITNNSPGGCSDTLDLSIANPIAGGEYVWSTDDEFTNIVGNGIDFVGTDIPNFDGTIYSQLVDRANCTFGEGELEIETNFISVSYGEPFIICPGDTAEFSVENLIPTQNLTYIWKDENGFIVSGADTAAPTIGIPENQEDDFFMVLCTENQFLCTSADTVFFEISEPMETIGFTWMAEDCGSLTVMFDNPNDFGTGNTIWDFGDGNSSNEDDPTHTYDTEGNYNVTLSSANTICAGEAITQEVTLPDLPSVDVAMDTLLYGPTGPATVTATTTEDETLITWCFEDGTAILDDAGVPIVGNPLVYEPEQDTITVISKIEDDKGCVDSDTTVLIKMRSLPPMINTDAPEMVCVMDTFPLSVDFEGSIEDFTFDWQPAECILSGGETPNATGTIVTSSPEGKQFTVLMTHIDSGIDTLIAITVTTDDPIVSIFPDNGIPDQEGLPQVCQGGDIDLSADPSDPDCVYTWSNGETGTDITVSPDENTTYTLECITPLGCENSASIDIAVLPPQCNEDDVFVPNAFSPNNDGVNDQLFVRSKFIQEMEFFVTNRWGEEVWRTTDQDQGWDGTFKGKTLAPDAYAYCLKVTCVNETTYTTAGNVSIIK